MKLLLIIGLVTMCVFLSLAHIPPCQTEDGDWCYWDAKNMGNGEGQSSISLNGLIIPYGPYYNGEK